MSPLRTGRARRLRAVTFDCWSTLLVERNWTTAYHLRIDALAELASGAGRPTRFDTLREAFDAAWNHHMAQWVAGVSTNTRDLADHALERLGLRPEAKAREELVRVWEEASHCGDVEPVEGALDTLRALAREGLRLALVCDTGLTPGRVVRAHLERSGLLAHLDICVFSDEVGAPKPDPRPFLTALVALDVVPDESLHVGDLRRTDVAGARDVGMRSIRLRAVYDDPSSLPEADAVADSHEAVRELLE